MFDSCTLLNTSESFYYYYLFFFFLHRQQYMRQFGSTGKFQFVIVFDIHVKLRGLSLNLTILV